MAKRIKLPKRDTVWLRQYGILIKLSKAPFVTIERAFEDEDSTTWHQPCTGSTQLEVMNRYKIKLLVRELKYRERLKKNVTTFTHYEVKDWEHSGDFQEVHTDCLKLRALFNHHIHHGVTTQEIWRAFGQQVRLFRGAAALAKSNSLKLTYTLSNAIAKSYASMLNKEESRLRERVIQALDRRTTLIKDHSKSLDAGSVIAKYDI